MIIGICLWIFWTILYISYWTTDTDNLNPSREAFGRYKFIQPLLECENTTTLSNRKYIPFEKKLKEQILAYQSKNHSGTHLSFYFRDLQNWPWFSNNYTEGFYPASLLKTPILMSYVKWAELDPTILKRKFIIQKYEDFDQNFVPEKQAEVWKEYSVEELLEIMTLYSDNNASSNLLMYLPEVITEDVFGTLQIPSPKDHSADSYRLNVKEYASFFRILFNASYLSDVWSEATLELLSRIKFDRGITGKLPKDTKVAHKFGERKYFEQLPNWQTRERAQLHDCGIIYYPWKPYLLCIMTRWDNMEQLSTMTQDISKMIYDTVDETQKKAQE
jgi:beta-lactamase class A